MKSIYVHLDPTSFSFSKELNFSNYTFNSLPDYALVSIEQTKHFLKEEPILLTNKNIVEFENEIETFFNVCKKGFPSFYKDPFWLLTLLRVYVVYLYAIKNNITEFIHLEYDNHIYSDLQVLSKLPPSLYFTRVGPYCSSAGFVYCNSLTSFTDFINKTIQLITKGELFVKQFTSYDHLSEMIMIDLIYQHTKGIIDYLPILPEGIGSDNFDKLKTLFDGASYGQYIGGTNNGHKEGYIGEHHYVGQQILKNNIQISFDRTPFIIFNKKRIDIQNLHIHSKKLNKFKV